MPAPPPIAYFHEPPRSRGEYLKPTWEASSRASGFKISCYFADVYRAAPWPRSGGFCYLRNARADPKLGTLLLPSDLETSWSMPWEARDNYPYERPEQALSQNMRYILGTDWETLTSGKDLGEMRGSLRFTNASGDDPKLCGKNDLATRTVMLTPLGDARSMKHWAVTTFAAFSLNNHLRKDYGLPPITHLLSGLYNNSLSPKPNRNKWVDMMAAILPTAMGAEVVRGVTLNEKQVPSTKFRSHLQPPTIPPWSLSCFNGVMVGIGAGHSIDPLWMLDRTDILRLRRALARGLIRAEHTTSRTATAAATATAASSHDADADGGARALPRPSRGSPLSTVYALATTSVHEAAKQAHISDPAALKVLLVNRRTRRIGNIPSIVAALERDSADPSRRWCAPLAGECDLDWKVRSVDVTEMESLSPQAQVAKWLDGPSVVIVPHGAGTTHVTYLPPCAIVIEVMPHLYPQFSFYVPAVRSGAHMLYLLETTALGNPQLACLNTTLGATRVARADPVFHVQESILLQLMHRGAHLRRRCLAHYPSVEFLPHERIQQTGHFLTGDVDKWQKLPQLLGMQEANQFDYEVPTIATGPGVTRRMAAMPSSVAARSAIWQCRTHVQHGSLKPGHPCRPKFISPQDKLRAYTSLQAGEEKLALTKALLKKGGSHHRETAHRPRARAPSPMMSRACASTCSALTFIEGDEGACRSCLHTEVLKRLFDEYLAPRDAAHRRELRGRSACLPPAKGRAYLTTKHGWRMYKAALFNESCFSRGAAFKRLVQLPYMWRDRIAEVCDLTPHYAQNTLATSNVSSSQRKREGLGRRVWDFFAKPL